MPLLSLNEICIKLRSGKSIPSVQVSREGLYPVIGGNGLRGYASEYNFDGECAVIGRQGAACGNVRYFSGKCYMTEHAVIAETTHSHNARYLAYLLSMQQLGRLSGQSAQPGISVKMLGMQRFDMPTLEYQRKVVSILGALDDKILVNSRINDHLLEMALSEYMELSRQSSSKRTLQDCTSLLCRGGAPKYCEKGKFRALNQRCIRNHKIDDANARRIENPKSREKLLRYGDILICSTGTGTLGRSAQVLCHDERVTVIVSPTLV